MTFYTPLSFRDAIFTAFDAVWADLTPVAFPNVEFKPAGLDAWARFELDASGEVSSRYSGSVNPALFVQQGFARVQCFVRQDADTDFAYDMAERALSFFQRQRISGVIFQEIRTPEEIGPDGPWWQVAVRSGWRYFSQRAD